jgi:tetratricopeptide (TPR) repeat protein
MNKVLLFGSVLLLAAPVPGQTLSEAQLPRALRLAQTGRCAEAFPLLKSAAGQPAKLRRDFKVAGVRCAMALNRPADALGFAAVLQREFPSDPEILYLLTHIYSDLSVRASQELLSRAPASYQVHQLNAEALETQGRWDDAAKEYEAILQSNPDVPGIHFRLGRLLLSRQPQAANQMEQARTQFEAELKVNPQHAGAEFVLGELARREDKFEDAIAHFSRAVQYDAGNADAHLGLGRSYMGAGRHKDAIPPLESAARMQPENPETHFQLAIAYGRDGRKADAARETEIHKEMLSRAQQRRDAISKGVKGIADP